MSLSKHLLQDSTSLQNHIKRQRTDSSTTSSHNINCLLQNLSSPISHTKSLYTQRMCSLNNVLESISQLNIHDGLKLLKSDIAPWLQQLPNIDQIIACLQYSVKNKLKWRAPIPDITFSILSFCETSDLYVLLRLNKYWNQDLMSPIHWKYVDCRYDFQIFNEDPAKKIKLLDCINSVPIHALTLKNNSDMCNTASSNNLHGFDDSLIALNLSICRGFMPKTSGRVRDRWIIPSQLQYLHLKQCQISHWNSLGFINATSLRVLAIFLCEIQSTELLSILRQCPQLTSLQLHQMNDIITIDDKLRKYIFSSNTLLQELFLSDTPQLLYPSVTGNLSARSSIINDYTATNIHTLTLLSISLGEREDAPILKVFATFNSLLHLTIELRACLLVNLKAACFRHQLQSLILRIRPRDESGPPSLIDFQFLQDFKQLTDFQCVLPSTFNFIHFQTIAQSCIHLSTVVLAFNTNLLSQPHFETLSKLQSLSSLDVYFCESIVPDHLHVFLNHPHLILLNIDLAENLQDKATIKELRRKNKGLQIIHSNLNDNFNKFNSVLPENWSTNDAHYEWQWKETLKQM